MNDTDNRDMSDIDRSNEATIEALRRRVAELEEEVENYRVQESMCNC